MDDINSQEALEAEAEAFEQLMIARADKEVERMAEEEAVHQLMNEYISEMEWRDEEINALNNWNEDPNLDEETKADNYK
jgi:hypothetical protein